MRTINLATVLNRLNGVPLKRGGVEEDRDETAVVADILVDVLMRDEQGDGVAPKKPLKAAEKIKRFSLAKRIYERRTSDIILKDEEIVLLKSLVGVVCPTLIVGQVFEVLEPGSTVDAEAKEE